MNTSAKVVMGIDVCQARLDTCRSDTGEASTFANDEKGILRLLRQLKSHPVDLVVCEAAGDAVNWSKCGRRKENDVSPQQRRWVRTSTCTSTG